MDFAQNMGSYIPSVGMVLDVMKKVGNGVNKLTGVKTGATGDIPLPSSLRNLDVSTLVRTGEPIIRIAAISGAAAVVLGAYGKHSLEVKDVYEERKIIYSLANRYHFLHTLAFFGVPMSRCPKTAASFFTLGILLFCGTCYYEAFTGKTDLKKITPIGGLSFLLGWLCMVL